MATVHGGLDTAELRSLGLLPEHVLDFSANVNPLSPSRLESSRPRRLRDLVLLPGPVQPGLAGEFGGTVECGQLITCWSATAPRKSSTCSPAPFLDRRKKCLIFAPAFGEYEAAARLAGAEVCGCSGPEEEQRGFNGRWMQSVEEICARRGPAWYSSATPTIRRGCTSTAGDVERIHEAVGENGLFVLDDAYAPLADGQWDSIPLLRSGNLAILRSMTKDHALAGIRLGFMAAEPDIVSTVRRLQPAWSVNYHSPSSGHIRLGRCGTCG